MINCVFSDSKHWSIILSFIRERAQTPHLAQPGTFEFEYSSRWKALDELVKQQREQVNKSIKDAKEKLEAELESAKHEHQLMLMRHGRIYLDCFSIFRTFYLTLFCHAINHAAFNMKWLIYEFSMTSYKPSIDLPNVSLNLTNEIIEDVTVDQRNCLSPPSYSSAIWGWSAHACGGWVAQVCVRGCIEAKIMDLVYSRTKISSLCWV